jgi:hypothetical protein
LTTTTEVRGLEKETKPTNRTGNRSATVGHEEAIETEER